MTEKRLKNYIFPSMLAMVGTSVYILADTYFIAMAVGERGITALNLALPVYGAIFAVSYMIGTGSAIRYSLCRAMEKKEGERYFSNSIFWSLLFSSFFLGLGIFAPEIVLRAMGADDQIMATGFSYIRIVLCFSPAFMLNPTILSFVRNDDSPRKAMAATLFSSLFNIIFDYIFMFPMGLGMAGAALATGLSPLVSMAICMTHFLSPGNRIVFQKRLPSIRRLLEACPLGFASFIGEVSNGLTCMVFNFLLLHLVGNVAVASYGVVANLSLVAIAIFNGISQGLQPMASQAEGFRNVEEKKRILAYSLKVGLVVAAALIAGSYLATDWIVSLFNRDHSVEMAVYAGTGLRIYCLGFLFAVVNIIAAGYCSATGRGRGATIISLSRGIAAIVFFALLLSRLLGIYGVWLAFPASELTTCLLAFWVMGNDRIEKE